MLSVLRIFFTLNGTFDESITNNTDLINSLISSFNNMEQEWKKPFPTCKNLFGIETKNYFFVGVKNLLLVFFLRFGFFGSLSAEVKKQKS